MDMNVKNVEFVLSVGKVLTTSPSRFARNVKVPFTG